MSNFELRDDYMLENIISDFIIVDASTLITDQKFNIKSLNIKDVVNEIDQYKNETKVMIGDFEIADDFFLYLLVFDDHIIILPKSDLLQLQSFFSAFNSIYQYFFLNNRCENEIEDFLNSKFQKDTFDISKQTLFNKGRINRNMKEGIFQCIIKKSQLRTLNSNLLRKTIEQRSTIEYRLEDFVKIYDFQKSNDSNSVGLYFNKNDQLLYVLKKTEKNQSKSQFDNEKNYYHRIDNKCQFISNCFGFLETKESRFIIVEYIQNQTLFNFVNQRSKQLTYFDKLRIIIEIMIAIEYSHLNGIILRDLKSDNIMIDSNNDAVLIDFDQTKIIENSNSKEMTGDIGSLYFSAPEQFMSNKYSNKVDIYSLGMIIHLILTQEQFHYNALSIFDEMKETEKNIFDLEEGIKFDEKYEKMNKIYKNCLRYNPQERPNISKILNDVLIEFHEFFSKQFDFELIRWLIQKRKEQFNHFLNSPYYKENELVFEISYFYGIMHYKKNKYQEIEIRESIKYFEIASKNCNRNEASALQSQYFLGEIYFLGKGVKVDLEQSAFYLKNSANNGNAKSQYLLGRIYSDEHFNHFDIHKAINYLTLSANQNFVLAQKSLGLIYLEGKHIQRDVNKSIHYLTLSSNQNDSAAQCMLGSIFYKDKNILRDINKAIHYLTLSANQNNKHAQYLLGKIYYENKNDVNKAIQFLTLSSNQNDSDAQFLLGQIYFDAKNDVNKAIQLLTLSSNQNNHYAQFQLGNIYLINKKDVKRSIYYFTMSANQNNSDALYFLGRIYSTGEYVKCDMKKSIYYLTMSSNQNNSHAQLLLGRIYYSQNDINKAIQYLTLSSNQNNSNALYLLGFIYFNGEHFQSDVNKAIHYLTLSSNLNNSGAQCLLGEIYYSNLKDVNKAIHYLTLSSNNQNELAQYLLGEIYLIGDLIPIDIDKSLHYFTLSSNHNFSEAQFAIGCIYLRGKKVKRDIQKSLHFFNLAANNNNPNAQFFLGVIYYIGEFVPVDLKKSLHFLLLSSDQNNSDAQYFLGISFYSGEKFRRDINKSLHFFYLSANQNNSRAQFALGCILLYGEYVKKDVNKGIHYLMLSSEQNNISSLFHLAEIYYKGEVVSRDMAKAIRYYKESSSFNNCMAKNNLGVIYKNGDGVQKNISYSIEYFNEAIHLKNDLLATYNLARVYFFGIDIERDLKKSIQLLEKVNSIEKDFYPINLFLFFIYSYGDESLINKDKANFYQSRFINEFDPMPFIKFFLALRFDESEFDSIIEKRMKTFFKEYDLLYIDGLDYSSDFIVFMSTGSFTCEKELNDKVALNLKKQMKDVDDNFYCGFYN